MGVKKKKRIFFPKAQASKRINPSTYTISSKFRSCSNFLPVRLSDRMRLHMRIPIFLPTIALITKLALEWLHTKMFVHVLTKISSFKETFFTSVIIKFNQSDHFILLFKTNFQDSVYSWVSRTLQNDANLKHKNLLLFQSCNKASGL